MTKLIQAVLFDLDGTLIDSEPATVQAVKDCFKSWGLTISPDDEKYAPGRTWESTARFLAERYPLPFEVSEVEELMVARFRELLHQSLTEVPGASAAVRSLAQHYDLGLVSGSGRQEILWALEKLDITEYFAVVLGAEDYSQSKPNPECYLKAIETLGAAPARTVVFEDSVAGIAAGRAAGLRVVAVTSTNHLKQDLSHAHAWIADLRKVTPQWLESQMETVTRTGK